MNLRFYGALVALAIACGACSNGQSIGGSIQPEKDVVSTDTATFAIGSETTLVDSILQRNSIGILGEYTDHRFGTTKADYMAQFYCSPNFSFGDITDNEIDSAFLYLFFDEWFGDDNALFEVSVYQLHTALDLDQPYYTNLDVARYCDKSKKLGSTVFTPASAKNTWTSLYDNCIRVSLDREFAQKIYNDNKDSLNYPDAFDGPRQFADYFKGLYISTSYGNGSLVYISYAQLEFCYNYIHPKTGTDTIAASYFPATKEVKQVNRYDHPDLTAYLPTNPHDSLNYLYAPAGLYTRIELPIDEIISRLDHKNINYARLKVSATDIDDAKWGLNPPTKLMLIREDDLQSFFANYSQADNLYSFVSTYDKGSKSFVFNISPYVQRMIRQADNEASNDFVPYNKMLLVPVEEISNNDKVSLYLLPQTKPAGVKIKSAYHPTDPMKLELIFSEQHNQ